MDLLERKDLDVTRGLHYRYYDSSASDADTSLPVLLLCHGWPDSASVWQYVVPLLLKSKNRIIVPDLLGAGGTSHPTDPACFEIKHMVEDIQEILDAENILQKIIPVGHDWGSYLAQRFYMLNKSRAAGVVTLNLPWTAPYSDPFDLDAFNVYTQAQLGFPLYAFWELLTDPDVDEVMENKLESVYNLLHGGTEEDMQNIFCVRGAMRKFVGEGKRDLPLKAYAANPRLHDAWIAERSSQGMKSCCTWYTAHQENRQLETERTLDAQVVTPYLHITCDKDLFCQPAFLDIAKKAGLFTDEQLTLEVVHSGHLCMYEKPVEVAEALLRWLGTNGFSGGEGV